MKNKETRQKRVVAKGETSGHSHIITGEAEVINDNGNITVKVMGKCNLKHLLENTFVEEGIEQWTEEHYDAPLSDLIKKAKNGDVFIRHGDVFVEKVDDETCKIIIQSQYNPYEKLVQKVQD